MAKSSSTTAIMRAKRGKKGLGRFTPKRGKKGLGQSFPGENWSGGYRLLHRYFLQTECDGWSDYYKNKFSLLKLKNNKYI